MQALGYLVPLMLLCAALGSQVADVAAVRKSSPAKATVPSGHPQAAQQGVGHQAAGPTKTMALTVSSLSTAHTSAPPAKTAAERKRKTHRIAGRKLAGSTIADDLADERRPAATSAAAAPTPGSGSATPAGNLYAAAPASTPSTPWPTSSAGLAGNSIESETEVVLKSALSKSSVKQGAYPFIVTIQKLCGGCHTHHSCAGVLLAPQWIITLSPCAETHPGETLMVRAGDVYIWPGDKSPTQKVMEVLWHEASTSTDDYPRYDVILMKLENPFQFNDNINAINLAPPTHGADSAVAVVGWSTPSSSSQQLEVNVTRTTVKEVDGCQKIAPQDVLPADTLCMQPSEPYLDRCAYDVGDPIITEGDSPQLVGLLSRWYLPCIPERFIAGIKITQPIYSWIYEKVNPQPVTARPSPTPSHTPPQDATTPTSTASSAAPPTTPSSSGTSTLPSSTTSSSTQPPTTPPSPPPPPPPPTLGPAPPPTTVVAVPTPPPTPAPTPPTSPSGGGSTATPPTSPVRVKPMTVSSSSASGALTNTSSSSDVAFHGHFESSQSHSFGIATMEPSKPALSNSVSVGAANCKEVNGALGMSYALAFSFIAEGQASAASTVNATCMEQNAVQSQGWSISTGGNAHLNVRNFIMEHLATIPGLPRQPTLKYL